MKKEIANLQSQKWSKMAFTELIFKLPKKIQHSTIEPHICFRKETALKTTYIRKITRQYQELAIFFPCYRFAEAAITRKKIKNGQTNKQEPPEPH